MALSAALLALTLSAPVSELPVCFDTVVLGSVDRIESVTRPSGLALGATAEWTIRVTRHERGEATPASLVATGPAESAPQLRTVLRLFLKRDGGQHYRAVFWTAFATPRPRLPAGLRACS
jgi:hypothetical protein